MSVPIDHHYIPVFYLKQWTGGDEQLCVYSRPYKEVKAKRKYPTATGFNECLYTLPDVAPELAQVIEQKLMASVDNRAALALADLLKEEQQPGVMNPEKGVGWAQFMYSLLVRTPEQLAKIQDQIANMSPDVLDNIKDEYHSLKKEGDPATFEEFKAEFAKNRIKVAASYVLPHLLGSKRMAKELVSLKWFTRIVAKAKFPLLTSDRPVIMTNGLKSDDAHIVLPISPRIAFVACRSEHKAAEIASMDSDFLARQINDRVALQAVKYVYGVDDNQLTFVEKRLGARLPCSPIG